mmetsp:Transcript_51644/g.137859  ORF Transcript_51644/g.137859 Transcript_51644/m.137859 type:complete len:154 (+) Transcript_51644:283-744(+)
MARCPLTMPAMLTRILTPWDPHGRARTRLDRGVTKSSKQDGAKNRFSVHHGKEHCPSEVAHEEQTEESRRLDLCATFCRHPVGQHVQQPRKENAPVVSFDDGTRNRFDRAVFLVHPLCAGLLCASSHGEAGGDRSCLRFAASGTSRSTLAHVS